jgi:bzd-type benzoyl-CoA reductase N subunit
MIEAFRKAFSDRFVKAKSHKEAGQKVIGWMCIYTPEELLHAGGFYPYRILGHPGKTLQADAYFPSNMCSFARNCLEGIFDGTYDFLDGFVTSNNCDHIRRFYDICYQYRDLPFMEILHVPHIISPESEKYFIQQLRSFKKNLEQKFNLPEISDEAIKQSIRLFNRMRALLRQVYLLRSSEQPPLTGVEALEIVRAGMVLPKEEYNAMLEDLLPKLSNKSPTNSNQLYRLLLSGSEMDDVDYISLIENLGGLVVTDDLCNGTRYFWDLVDEEEKDPLVALGKRYLRHSPCARIQPLDNRINHLREMIQTFSVDGIIMQYLKFCDLYGADLPILKRAVKDLNIPILCLDREYGVSGVGQMKTRVQAFFEMLEAA